MNIRDTFKYLVGAYYGITEMDEYDLKEYILKNIELYIIDFIKQNPLDIDLYKEAELIKDELSLTTKLQDALIVLPKVNASTELILLVKQRLRQIKEGE